MAGKGMDVYLNDHLAGAVLGSDLAEQLHARSEGTRLGDLMASLALEIEEDRQTLIGVMQRIGVSKNPVKQATTWMAEKASRAKFSGLTSGEPELGRFIALETLSLGVEGKTSLWTALKEVADQCAPLKSVDLDTLINRAQTQRSMLERERITASARALRNDLANLT